MVTLFATGTSLKELYKNLLIRGLMHKRNTSVAYASNSYISAFSNWSLQFWPPLGLSGLQEFAQVGETEAAAQTSSVDPTGLGAVSAPPGATGRGWLAAHELWSAQKQQHARKRLMIGFPENNMHTGTCIYIYNYKVNRHKGYVATTHKS